jgi:hypothetical protein
LIFADSILMMPYFTFFLIQHITRLLKISKCFEI